MLIDIENVREKREFYEMTIYSMSSISEIFNSRLMRYNESRLYDKFRNDPVSHPYYELNTDLLR
jgi:hypothetical protein